jgi:hypothetical protein
MGKIKNTYKIMIVKLKGRGHVSSRGLNGRVILKYILDKTDLNVGIGLKWLGSGFSCVFL